MKFELLPLGRSSLIPYAFQNILKRTIKREKEF
jgi:hypothetical protein